MKLFKLDDVLKEMNKDFDKNYVIDVLNRNPQFYEIKNNEYYLNPRGKSFLERNNYEQLERTYVDGISTLDLRGFNIKGDILDIGAGGEGIIARLFHDQVIGIAPKEHEAGLVNAPSCKYKICMDAREMMFTDNSFSNITSFFTLMYINFEDYQLVFNEAYRVLKTGGKFYIWDLLLPENNKSIPRYVRYFKFILPDTTINTGYGTIWEDRRSTLSLFKEYASNAGFKIESTSITDRTIHLVLEK